MTRFFKFILVGIVLSSIFWLSNVFWYLVVSGTLEAALKAERESCKEVQAESYTTELRALASDEKIQRQMIDIGVHEHCLTGKDITPSEAFQRLSNAKKCGSSK